MEYSRRFLLRHVQGFTKRRFAWFCVGCSEWRGYVNGVMQLRPVLWPDSTPTGDYLIGEPQLDPDTLVAFLPMGGSSDYFLAKWFEDDVPRQLHQHLPIWFLLELETAYVNPAFGRAAPSWQPLFTDEQRDELRTNPAYQDSVNTQTW